MANNKPAFIREDGHKKGKNHYLAWYHEYWHIQPDEWFLEAKAGGHYRVHAPGKYFHNFFLSVRKFIGYHYF